MTTTTPTTVILDASAPIKSIPIAPVSTDAVAKPIVESISKPVVKPVAKPVAKPIVEPVAEPIAEPIAELVVAKPIAEPVFEPVVDGNDDGGGMTEAEKVDDRKREDAEEAALEAKRLADEEVSEAAILAQEEADEKKAREDEDAAEEKRVKKELANEEKRAAKAEAKAKASEAKKQAAQDKIDETQAQKEKEDEEIAEMDDEMNDAIEKAEEIAIKQTQDADDEKELVDKWNKRHDAAKRGLATSVRLVVKARTKRSRAESMAEPVIRRKLFKNSKGQKAIALSRRCEKDSKNALESSVGEMRSLVELMKTRTSELQMEIVQQEKEMARCDERIVYIDALKTSSIKEKKEKKSKSEKIPAEAVDA